MADYARHITTGPQIFGRCGVSGRISNFHKLLFIQLECVLFVKIWILGIREFIWRAAHFCSTSFFNPFAPCNFPELEDVIEDQLSLASIHYLRSHYQESIKKLTNF